MMAEDVSQFLKPKFSRHLFYDTDGNTTENEVPKACAYIITIDDKESYYVKFLRGSLFDPQGIDGLKINSLNSSLVFGLKPQCFCKISTSQVILVPKREKAKNLNSSSEIL